MKLILLSGGSGKRLWPLSNTSRSKQFLKVLRNSDLQMESMVQRVWRQLEMANLAESAYIATSEQQAETIRNHLGCHIPLIIEPERRDTFPAIALAAVYLFSKENLGPEETVCVMPVDSCVEQPFYHKIRELDPLLTNTGASLGLIGALPIYPSEKYGYLVPAAGEPNPDKAGYLSISRFQEKPDIETARRLIEQKALWNCGVFAFKLRYLLSILEQNGWSLRYDELAGQYGRLPAISFDYQVAEKAENIVALTYEGMWKDLGTWNTLTEEMDTRILGKGMISDDSDDTHVINELEIPVAVVGASGLVVACSPDGILVSKKAASHRVKDWIPSPPASPMFEERRWGWRRVLDHTVYPAGDEVLIQKLNIRSGSNLSYHYHQKRKKLWKILAGEGVFVLDDQQISAFAGDVLVIPAGTRHALKAATNMELIEVQTGTELTQEDRTRIYTHWEEIERHLAGRQQDRNRKGKVRKNDD